MTGVKVDFEDGGIVTPSAGKIRCLELVERLNASFPGIKRVIAIMELHYKAKALVRLRDGAASLSVHGSPQRRSTHALSPQDDLIARAPLWAHPKLRRLGPRLWPQYAGRFQPSPVDREIIELDKRKVQLLRRYSCFPLLISDRNRYGTELWWASTTRPRSGVGYNDHHAMRDIAALAEAGLLDRLRRCTCGRWIFARFAHQRFCGVKCQQKSFRSTPEWRKQRAEKARHYYHLHKSGKVREGKRP